MAYPRTIKCPACGSNMKKYKFDYVCPLCYERLEARKYFERE